VWTHSSAAELRAQAAVLRDVFGNPYRPAAFAPAWRTATAAAIARQIRDERDCSLMPILADALFRTPGARTPTS
jgi:hypothetical protein